MKTITILIRRAEMLEDAADGTSSLEEWRIFGEAALALRRAAARGGVYNDEDLEPLINLAYHDIEIAEKRCTGGMPREININGANYRLVTSPWYEQDVRTAKNRLNHLKAIMRRRQRSCLEESEKMLSKAFKEAFA